MSLRRFLVISLGNPGDFRETYHSAGHLALEAFQRYTETAHSQPPFTPSRIAKKAVRASVGPRFTLMQSPCVMNVSGPWVARAYREHLAEQNLLPSELGLVVVHDDLEEDLGVVKVREWKRSHRGHNGVKSVLASLRPSDVGSGLWARISLGIGRPLERDKSSVADFVLKKMSMSAREAVEASGGLKLLEGLEQLERKWEKKKGTESE